MLFRLNPYHHSIWFGYATQAAGFVAEQRWQLAQYTKLKSENERLSRRNVVLQQNLLAMRRRLAKLEREPSLTESEVTKQTEGLELIPAKVCYNSVRQRDNLMLINRGRADGVAAEQAVLSGTGIVGIVAQVSENYATVIPLLNSKSSVSCRIRGSEYFGYLHWNGGNPLVATLDDVPVHAHAKVGDTVETSGYSNIFPEGIFVGRVVSVGNSGDGLSLELAVKLGTDLACVNDVMVVVNPDSEELGDTLGQ